MITNSFIKTVFVYFSLVGCLTTYAQDSIQGKIIDQNGIDFPIATIYLFDDHKLLDSTISDMSGDFKFLNNYNHSLYIYGKLAGCYSDTIIISAENMRSIQLEICFSDSCKSNLMIPNCRHSYISEKDYYIEHLWDPDSIVIISGVEILARKSYSPYEFELIRPLKKYSDIHGNVYFGQDIIKMKYLPLVDWEDAGFKVIKEEINCK